MIYGAGDQKLGDCVGGTRRDGKSLRRKFYDRNPAFRKLVESIQEKAKKEGQLEGLDRRPLYPRSQHSALNLWIQNAAVTVAKRSTLLHLFFLELNGIRHGSDFTLAAHVHDEWQLEILEEHAEDAAELALPAIRAAGEYYQLKVALDGETKIGLTWADTH
jgi:DNA polymerase I-like protein with 3'-5' exonuclease and polymerase domains